MIMAQSGDGVCKCQFYKKKTPQRKNLHVVPWNYVTELAQVGLEIVVLRGKQVEFSKS